MCVHESCSGKRNCHGGNSPNQKVYVDRVWQPTLVTGPTELSLAWVKQSQNDKSPSCLPVCVWSKALLFHRNTDKIIFESTKSPLRNPHSPSPPRPGRDLVLVRRPCRPLLSLSQPLRLVLSTAFMCSCSAASSAWSRPWGCSISWLPPGALLLPLFEPRRPHCGDWNRLSEFGRSSVITILDFKTHQRWFKKNIQPVKITISLIQSDIQWKLWGNIISLKLVHPCTHTNTLVQTGWYLTLFFIIWLQEKGRVKVRE